MPRFLRIALWITLVSVATPATTHAQYGGGPIELYGVELVDEAVIRRAAGRVPRRAENRENWAQRAVERIVSTYQRRGFDYARAWWRVSEDGDVLIEVDEGKLGQIVFAGAGVLQGLRYQFSLGLTRDVFQREVVEEALEELRERFSLREVAYEVKDTGKTTKTEHGFIATQRVLSVQVTSRERLGWGVGITIDAQWGLLPRGRVRLTDLAGEGDRLEGELGISIPYRRFLFEEVPRFRWLHGHVFLLYVAPEISLGVAPATNTRFDSSIYTREDLGVRTYHEAQATAQVGLEILPTDWLTISTRIGVDWIGAWIQELTPEEERINSVEPPTGSAQRIRAVATAGFMMDFSTDVIRQDLHDVLGLNASVYVTDRGEAIVDARLVGQGAIDIGFDNFIIAGRALFVGGSAKFWDDVPLSGTYMRSFLNRRYWIREAAQLQLEYRLSLLDERVKMSVWNDSALFGDRTTGERTLGWATAVGPGLHFLVYDLVGIDLYYAFGFDKAGWDHNFKFSVGTVF